MSLPGEGLPTSPSIEELSAELVADVPVQEFEMSSGTKVARQSVMWQYHSGSEVAYYLLRHTLYNEQPAPLVSLMVLLQDENNFCESEELVYEAANRDCFTSKRVGWQHPEPIPAGAVSDVFENLAMEFAATGYEPTPSGQEEITMVMLYQTEQVKRDKRVRDVLARAMENISYGEPRDVDGELRHVGRNTEGISPDGDSVMLDEAREVDGSRYGHQITITRHREDGPIVHQDTFTYFFGDGVLMRHRNDLDMRLSRAEIIERASQSVDLGAQLGISLANEEDRADFFKLLEETIWESQGTSGANREAEG